MAWSTEETRAQAAALTMREALSEECWEDDWTPEDRRDLLEGVRAARFSGLDRYPTMMRMTRDGLIGAMERNGLADVYDAMDYLQRGAMLVAFKEGFDAGRAWERDNPGEV